jgi:hypothetical protein
LTSAVLRKDCSKFWPNRYAHFQAAIPQTLWSILSGEGLGSGTKGFAAITSSVIPGLDTHSKEKMVMPTKTTCKVLEFATPQASVEGELEKWFRGVMKSNHDLVFALERLRDSYKQLLGERPVSEANQAVLLAVEITLRDARNARAL